MKAFAIKKQQGVTLIELIAGLAVMAVVIGGALSLYSSASASQSATQMAQDLTALRAATKQIWQGQGTYGAAATNLNDVLVVSKRVPTTIKVDTTTSPDTLTHQEDGTVTIASTGSGFSITLTEIDEEICVPLMTGSVGWNSVKAGTATAVTSFPVNPASAATDCATGTTMVFTSN